MIISSTYGGPPVVHADRIGFALIAALLATFTIAPPRAKAQESTYRLVDGWAELPSGVGAWGQTIGVEVDDDGNLWVFHRCFSTSCDEGREDVTPILKYDSSGRLVDSWGEGMFIWPHGFLLDNDGNVWTTDARGADGKGHQIMKFTADGTLLMTIGTAGVAGEGQNTFDGPTDVAVAPNGDIFVADGHGNNRVVKFSKDGQFVMEWGGAGTGPGQFSEPHCLVFDSRGRLFVGDRLNERIQVFDQTGRYLAEWTGIMASGMDITADDVLYVADYQLRKGIVIANASDFSEIGFIENAMPEGVTVDRMGNVYAGEVLSRNLKKFVRN
jgi:DNA-binding beta-propeller fold protein YncE